MRNASRHLSALAIVTSAVLLLAQTVDAQPRGRRGGGGRPGGGVENRPGARGERDDGPPGRKGPPGHDGAKRRGPPCDEATVSESAEDDSLADVAKGAAVEVLTEVGKDAAEALVKEVMSKDVNVTGLAGAALLLGKAKVLLEKEAAKKSKEAAAALMAIEMAVTQLNTGLELAKKTKAATE